MMATIDKLYGTREQRRELKRFLMRHRKRAWLRYVYPVRSQQWANGEAAIACFPSFVDRWLWKNCTLQFVRDRLEEQYKAKQERRLFIEEIEAHFVRVHRINQGLEQP